MKVENIERRAKSLYEEEVDLLKRAPELAGWMDCSLERLVRIYDEYRAIGRVTLDDRIVALGLCRPIHLSDEKARKDRYAFDEGGDTLWITGVVVSPELQGRHRRWAIAELWVLMLRRFGRKLWVGYDREKDGRPARIFPFNQLERRFLSYVV